MNALTKPSTWNHLHADPSRMSPTIRKGKTHFRRIYTVGTRYQNRGSGIDGGKIGILLRRNEIPLNDRGIPKIAGSYKTLWQMLCSGWIYLRTDAGEIIEVPCGGCWPV